MCECGCGGWPKLKLKGPKGITYAIEFYNGCADCSAPAGITIHKMTHKRARESEVSALPELEFSGDDDDLEFGVTADLPVLDVETLTAALVKRVAACTIRDVGIVPFAIEECVPDAFNDAIAKTQDLFFHPEKRFARGSESAEES
jgi:hypothetical protein